MNPYRNIGLKIQHRRDFLDMTQVQVAEKVAELLRPDQISAREVQRIRELLGMTQQEIITEMNAVLESCNTVGTPTRMAFSKVENARRRLDFLEAMAICVVLGITPWALLPEGIQNRKPTPSLAQLWVYRGQEQSCYTFEHLYSATKILTLAIEPALVIEPGQRKWISLEDIIGLNPWVEPFIAPVLKDPELNPHSFSIESTPA